MEESEGIIIKTWKASPRDKETTFEVPMKYGRVKDVFLIQGGRVAGEMWCNTRNLHYYLIKLADNKIEETLTIIKRLRQRGIDMTGEPPGETDEAP